MDAFAVGSQFSLLPWKLETFTAHVQPAHVIVLHEAFGSS